MASTASKPRAASALPPHDVADLGLADEGVRRIEWAEREMPVLRLIRERFEREKPLAGLRLAACLHDISESKPGCRILVVTHTTAIRLTLCHLLGAPLSDYRRLFPAIHNCALTEIRMTGRRPALLQFNVPI